MENHSNSPALTSSQLERQAQVLAKDFIAYRLGKNQHPSTTTAATLRRLADQIEEQYPSLLDHLCHKLNISRSTVYATFAEIASEVFSDGVNWGRIVALYAFGGKLALYCERNDMKDLVDSVTDWTGTYVGRHSEWIESNGGWVSGKGSFPRIFVTFFAIFLVCFTFIILSASHLWGFYYRKYFIHFFITSATASIYNWMLSSKHVRVPPFLCRFHFEGINYELETEKSFTPPQL